MASGNCNNEMQMGSLLCTKEKAHNLMIFSSQHNGTSQFGYPQIPHACCTH
ncbi:hypothetical protein YC2023_006198 [Brassica napus]